MQRINSKKVSMVRVVSAAFLVIVSFSNHLSAAMPCECSEKHNVPWNQAKNPGDKRFVEIRKKMKTPLKDQKSILTNETLDFTHKADNPDLPNYHRYNLGWGIVNDGQNLSLISDGRIGGANSMLLLLPEQKIAVACISNMTGGITMMTAIQIVDMLIPGYMKNIMNFIEPMGAVENLRVPFKVEPKLEGEWQGEIKTYQGKIPITMTFADDASVTAKIGNQPVAQVMDLNFVDQPDTVVNHIKFFYRILTGTINSTIPTPDAGKGEHTISLKLRYVNGNLVGSGTAIGEGFALPSFIKLSRKR